ncbi:MAG TPA: hypothetical protein VG328_25970 [Stellaceae bacterium]|nr:hypothetical protein [Stellaceae bacterium]
MRKFLAGAVTALALSVAMSAAKADDPGPSAVHAFVDLSVKNAYITPRGLLVTNKGLTTQILSGLAFDLYSDPSALVSDVSLTAGFWNDIASAQNASKVGPWNEFDWFIGPNVTFLKDWTAGASFVEFLSPPGNFKAEKNLEFSLSFNDSPYLKPVSFHPYAKLFWAIDGDSTVVLGRRGDTYDVELGLVPTIDVTPGGIPVTLTMPTWITVGPQNYWGGTSHFGVISTGLSAKTPLTFIPARYGKWYADVGIQYYNLINGKLVAAQIADGVSGTNTTGNNNVWVGSAGVGFSF